MKSRIFRRIPGCFKLSWDTHHGYSGLQWPPRASVVVSVEQTQSFHHDLPLNTLLFTWHPAQHLTFPYTSLLLLQPRAQYQPLTASSIQWPAMISKSASLECLITTIYYSYEFWYHLSGAWNKQQHCHRAPKHRAPWEMLFQSRLTPCAHQYQGYRLPLLFMWWYFHSTLKIKMIQYKAKIT